MVLADVEQWSQFTFGGVQLGDVRRTRRLVYSAARIAAQPEKSFPQIFDWNQLRGFYGVCDQQSATPEALQGPHWQQTRLAMAAEPLVLIVHDTSEMDYTSHKALKGKGPIGNGSGTGFLQHNSLAVLPQPKSVLGLAYQQLRTRKPAPKKESTQQRKKRRRESALWLEGIRATGEPPQGSVWVDVGDRGSDIYEAMEAARQVQHHFLLRASQNRKVFLAADGSEQALLLDYARTLSSQGQDQVEIPGRGGRPARTATVALAGAPVWVPAPKNVAKSKSRPILEAWIIRIWEPNPPADVKEPLEWFLLCSLPSITLEELKERRDWYVCRWLVEVFHDIEKNGCSEEDRRFETAERMAACLAILALVAVRVFQMRLALQTCPQAPAEQVASAAEIEVMRKWLGQRQGLTVRQFVRGVAKLGGFLGRKGDGEPGVRALWRGYQRLQDMLVGFGLHDDSASAPPRGGHSGDQKQAQGSGLAEQREGP